MQQNYKFITKLCNLEEIEYGKDVEKPAKFAKVVIKTANENELKTIEENYKFITKLCNLEEIEYGNANVRFCQQHTLERIFTRLENNGIRINRSPFGDSIGTACLKFWMRGKMVHEMGGNILNA